MTALNAILAENLLRLRKDRGLSQEALAWKAGVSRRYMSKLEGGQVDTGLAVLAKLAVALDVQPWELLKTLGPAD
jgi:transcriptional regulator with XRE-family HTH domain